MSNKNLMAVVVLKERLINNIFPIDAPLFEESIYLIDLDLTNLGKIECIKRIKEKLKTVELSYKNDQGETIEWRIYKIIDIYTSIYHLQTTVLPNEIYSRHLSVKREAVLSKFYSDYAWEDAAE